MTKKMVMDSDRLKEVLEFSRIGLPEDEFCEVLDRVNAVLRMCDDMQELDCSSIAPFEWKTQKTHERREDVAVLWDGRDDFMNSAPVRDGDFFKVPRIIAVDCDSRQDEFAEEA